MLEADRIYQVCERSLAGRALVEDELLYQYSKEVEAFVRSLGDDLEGDPWPRQILGTLRRIRWDLLQIPLPRSDAALGLADMVSTLRPWARVASTLSGQSVASALQAALELAGELSRSSDTPLGREVADQLGASGNRRLVVRSARLAPAVETWLLEQGVVTKVLVPPQVVRAEVVDLCCVAGASRWHPTHLVTAPRAEITMFVYHEWIRDDDKATGPLAAAGSHYARDIEVSARPVRDGGPTAGELEIGIDWDAIAKARGASDDAEWDDADNARAFTVLVAGGRRVFLEDDASSVVYVVQPTATRGHRVRREHCSRVQVGDYLLLRMERGRDDIIRLLADALLKDRAAPLRKRQARWKAALQKRVDSVGFSQALADLDRLGMEARNIRGWLDRDTLRTSSESDFILLMRYCGLEDEAAALWRSMRVLAKAHLVAGQRLRSLLEDEVEGADLDELVRAGTLDVKLKFEGTGSLGIFRVEAIAPTTTVVPRAKLRVLDEIGRDLWPE